MEKKKTVVIGISSGIAGYKIIDLIKILKKRNIDVSVVMTKNAARMFGVGQFESISGHKVFTQLFEDEFEYKKVLEKRKVDHIEIATIADLFLLAPATANTMAKIAHGIADDFLTTSILATNARVLICPSMNTVMWNHPATIINRERLRQMGYIVLSPDIGDLACGTWGSGRLLSVDAIARSVDMLLRSNKKLEDKRVVVTAGGTQESVDAVRVISNKSSGKMGVALADACWSRGAHVTLLRAKNSVVPRFPIAEKLFESTNELEKHLKELIPHADIVIHNAAVSDYLPSKTIDKKLDSRKSFTMHLTPAKKILYQIKKWNPKTFLIGFKAVYQLSRKQLIAEGKKKLKASDADFIAVNDVGKPGIGFGVDENEVYVVAAKGPINKIEKAPKRVIADKILDWIFGEAA